MAEFVVTEKCAEEYIRSLFKFVLGREATAFEEIDYWTKELMTGRSVSDVLQLFVASDEYKMRSSLSEVRTKYPHGHFYSPVVRTSDLLSARERLFVQVEPPNAIELNGDRQIELLRLLVRYFGDMIFVDQDTGVSRYYYNNTSYGFGDACIYWAMIGHYRPQRIVEIGSGFTSAMALDAIDYFGLPTICTFVDPYPQLLKRVAVPIDDKHQIVEKMVQDCPPNITNKLKANDLLFIDSSHVVKTGSDVHFELTKLLPNLASGVLVHFHDVFYPFEYPEPWVMAENHSWNEQYFLHAFLMYNNAFEILYFNDYVGKMHVEVLRDILPSAVADRVVLNPGGGLWLRKK